MKKATAFTLLSISVTLLLVAGGIQAQPSATRPVFTLEEVMIPMRDGVRLQTVILAPSDQKKPLPILFRRTPYGVPSQPPEQVPTSIKEQIGRASCRERV